MNQHELKNDWSRVQEMYSNFCTPARLEKEAKLGFAKDGKGAIFLYMANGHAVCTYAPQQWIDEYLDADDFKKRLLITIEDYRIDTQVIVLVTFDDIFLSESLSYQWFEIDILS